ncbi:MAG: UDP-N-acetylmuramoyl-L-alanyl-D-glutamate--2,6-diaminopimelate ligase [Firmicutes bacterium]|nr:UDP-N-acetylmuramoyl-L-alanyl-D-glutamate--2,6-diaminopimelate ligase [Alicyclobacillaceae bacterium]MCL6497607.1 UDP-N-acetylmuramoyl-L-alanyl-D-glutamate--2,6-diaminopimelate ligase [Bacillota bacterium]
MRIAMHGPPLCRITAPGVLEMASDVGKVTADSRRVEPRDLFVALPGQHTHGIRFVGEAIRRGAAGVVLPEDAPVPAGVERWIRTSQPRLLYAHLAHAAYGHPSRQLKVVAVTGTNGKTTTVEWAAQLLNRAGIKARTIGTLTPYAETRGLTTPVAEDVARLMHRAAAEGAAVVLVEASSHALVQHRLAGVQLSLAAVTSLGRDHLDFHRRLAAYWAAKRRLVKQPLSAWFLAPREGVLLPSSQEPPWTGFAAHVCTRLVRFGPQGQVRIRPLGLSLQGLQAEVEIQSLKRRLRLPLLSDTALPSLEAAVALTWMLGVEPRQLMALLPHLDPVPGREEWYLVPGGPWVVVDYAHNPQALEHLLAGIRRLLPKSRLTTVFGGRGHRDRGKLPLMGEVASRYAQRVVVTTDSPYDEDPYELAQAILSRAPFGEWIEDRQSAILSAVWRSRAGDVVVVTGRGHETDQYGPKGRLNTGSDGEWLLSVLGARRYRPRQGSTVPRWKAWTLPARLGEGQ